MGPFDGPWVITNIIAPSCYKISDKEGEIRGTFNRTAWGNQQLTECIEMVIGYSGGREGNIVHCM
jgi:hypothetical protein